MDSPFDENAIIILGAARSGTRLLRQIIAAGGVAQVPYDVNYVWRYGNENCPHDALTAEHVSPRTALFVRRQLARCAQLRSGANGCFVEKTVASVLRIPFVQKIFPAAKYVFLVRDGRDVIESAQRCWREPPKLGYLLEKLRTFPFFSCANYGMTYARTALERALGLKEYLRTWGPRYPGIDEDVKRLELLEVCARQWVVCMEHYEESRHVLSENQLHEVRYEELVRDPAGQAERLGRFLETANIERMRRFAQTATSADRIGSHRRLGVEQIELVEQIAGPVLERWEYRLTTESRRRAA